MHKWANQILMPVLKAMSKGYVAGETLDDALDVARDIIANGHGVTICYWHAEDEATDSIAECYAETIRRCCDAGIDFHLSVKIPAFKADMARVVKIVDNVRTRGGYVDFDSHRPEHADDVFRAAKLLGGERLGCAIPGRWRRSLEDAHQAIELGMRIRVVKGSFADDNAPEVELRKGYLGIIDAVAGKSREVGVATHDDWLASEAIRRLKRMKTPVEQELLFGLPMDSAAQKGARENVPLRVYIPYGAAWLPYSLSRALTNPQTMKWLALDMFRRQTFRVPAPRSF